MNHSFVSQPNSTLCAKCHYDMLSHMDNVACDACSNVGIVNVVNSMLLCDVCAEKEISIRSEVIPPHNEVNVENEVKQLAKEINPNLVTMETSMDFFNAETISLIELEKLILADENIPADQKYFELVARVRASYQDYRRILFEATKIQVEIASKQRAQQYYLNDLASRVSKQTRDELKLTNIEYQPKELPKAIPKVRLTPEEKIIASYAAAMNIPIEQARALVRNNMREAGITCTCQTEPGMCKLHNKQALNKKDNEINNEKG
jgi:hypothetical protein